MRSDRGLFGRFVVSLGFWLYNRFMYEIKKQIYLGLTKNQKSALCNYLRALVKKSMDLLVDEIWESFVADEKYYLELNCSRFEFLADIIDENEFKSDTIKYLKECKKQNEIYANALLDRVGLSDKKENYPCELSGGQQQRVAIARALALKPDILCFDEPTSALDPELTGEVLKVIKTLADENHTMIIVTHEMEFAKKVSDKVLFMADGIVEEFGTPEQVFDNPKSEKTKAFLQMAKEEI